jgi:hypothetical protein
MPLELDYGALCLDTSVFDGYGIALEKGWLEQLEQFAESPVKFLQSEIVHFELEGHLAKKITATRTAIEKALKDASNDLLISDSVIDRTKGALIGQQTDRQIAKSRLHQFYERTHAEIAPANIADMDTVVDMYFKLKAPFEEKKKAEFPDAIALVSLERWAELNKLKILVVSYDSGWEEYCATSERLDCVKDLKAALTHFQPHHKAEQVIHELHDEILRGADNQNSILLSITDALEESVGGLDVHAEADSSFMLEEQYMDAVYVGHDYTMDINLIGASSDSLVIQLGAEVEVEVVGAYSFSHRDPIDGDYVELGSRKVIQREKFLTDILLTLTGDFSRGLAGVEVKKVEMTETKVHVNFGELDMDWDDPERYGGL